MFGPWLFHPTRAPHGPWLHRWGRDNSSAPAGSCVLTFEKPNSTQQWNLRSEGQQFGEQSNRERKYVVVKKRKSIEGNTPHPVRWGRWVSKLPPPSIPSSFFLVCRPEQLRVLSAGLWLKSTVRENLFPIWAFPVNAGKRPFTQSTACEESRWSCCAPLSPFLLPAVPLQPKGMEWTFFNDTSL